MADYESTHQHASLLQAKIVVKNETIVHFCFFLLLILLLLSLSIIIVNNYHRWPTMMVCSCLTACHCFKLWVYYLVSLIWQMNFLFYSVLFISLWYLLSLVAALLGLAPHYQPRLHSLPCLCAWSAIAVTANSTNFEKNTQSGPKK